MALRVVLYVVVQSLLLIGYGIEDRKLSRKDKSDIEKQLRILRKPPVKTIRNNHGQLYDCIDFYKQPAFDHPLLKNHNFHPEMRPTITPKTIKFEHFPIKIETPKFGLKDKGCPNGTVPIRRVTRKDLIQIKFLTKEYASRLSPNNHQSNDATHVAAVRTSSIPYSKKMYKGVGATLSIYNLTVDNSQYSTGAITIQNGVDTIQVGWMVNPTLYKGNRTHCFAFLKADKFHCFNTLCPGFISVRTDMPIDDAFDSPLSTRGRVTKVYNWLIYQDIYSGNWWLGVGPNATLIGFWPKKIFTSLAEYGSSVACGGQVYSPPGQSNPPMGSGFRPKMDTRYDAFCAYFNIVNIAHEIEPVMDVEEYSDYDTYKVKDWGVTKPMGHLVVYGGPNKP